VITLRHLAADGASAPGQSALMDLKKPYQDLKEQAIEDFTLAYLNRLLGETGGNVSAAAQLSGMKRQSLQKIIKRYGIDVQQLRS
jgi:transcriptional regulator of acetoin/glycerol metabolism